MKKLLFFLLITIGFSLQHSLMANEPDSAYVFAYATDKNAGRNGLHFAWSTDRNTWHSIGPETHVLTKRICQRTARQTNVVTFTLINGKRRDVALPMERT